MAPLELYLLTFNCARYLVDTSTLGPRLFDAYPHPSGLPDLVVFSIQEISPIAYAFLGGSHLQPYYDRFASALSVASAERGGDSQTYEPIIAKNVGMTAVMVFAKARIASHIEQVRTATVGVGFWDMGNKGAVGVNIKYRADRAARPLDLTFIAVHLTHQEESVLKRNQDWETIVRNLVFADDEAPATKKPDSPETQPLLSEQSSRAESSALPTLYQKGSLVFIAGDFNYRTSDVSPGPEAHITYPQPVDSEDSPRHSSKWLKNDQLAREKHAGRTLHAFQEQPITFPPTYKYSSKAMAHARGVSNPTQPFSSSHQESDSWLWAKHRFPSWCDRILYLPPVSDSPKLDFHKYTSLPLQYTSDHQPVALSLALDPEVTASNTATDVRELPPFSINPDWKSRQWAARQKEIVVGVVAYLTLRREGQAITAATALAVFAAWYVFGGSYGR